RAGYRRRLIGPGKEVGVGERSFAPPAQFVRRLEPFERGGERGRRGVDRKLRVIDATELFDAGKHVHEGLAWPRNVEEGVTLRGHFAEPPADEQDEVGALHPREKLGIGSDAEVARVAGMRGIEQMRAAE